MKKHYYLYKNKKIFGPYDENQLQALISSQALEQFHWIWDTLSLKWSPIEPMPNIDPRDFNLINQTEAVNLNIKPNLSNPVKLAPNNEAQNDKNNLIQAVLNTKIQSDKNNTKEILTQAFYPTIMHNHTTSLSGTITQIGENLASLISNEKTKKRKFSVNSKVKILILDSEKNLTLEKTATIKKISFQKNSWIYDLILN